MSVGGWTAHGGCGGRESGVLGSDRGRQVVSTIEHFEVAVTTGKVAYMW